MLILVALGFAAVLALALVAIGETIETNGAKIIAALRGESWAARPVMVTRPVKVRIAARSVSRPLKARPQLRVAA